MLARAINRSGQRVRVVDCISSLVLATLLPGLSPGCPRMQAGPVGAHVPLAVHARQILGLPVGHRSYLPDLATLVKAVHPFLGRPEAGASAALRRQLAAERSIVAAINRGADPLALRNAILNSLTLAGVYAPRADGRPWKYGSDVDRMELVSLLRERAMEIRRNGRPRRAARYARASLFLGCQDDVQLGWRFPLQDWVSARDAEFKSNPAATAYLHKVRALLRIGAAQHAALNQLYLNPHGRSHKLTSEAQAIYTEGTADARLKSHIPAIHLQRLAKLVETCLAQIRGMHNKYGLLRNIYGAVRACVHGGHYRAARRIIVVLRGWISRIHREQTLSVPERNALTRWAEQIISIGAKPKLKGGRP